MESWHEMTIIFRNKMKKTIQRKKKIQSSVKYPIQRTSATLIQRSAETFQSPGDLLDSTLSGAIFSFSMLV